MSNYSAVVEKFFSIYSEEAVRNAQASNEKLEKLAGILMQIGFAIAGLGAARIAGHFQDLPFTFLGIMIAVLSIIFGTLQMITDFLFFSENMKNSRSVATAAFNTWMEPNNDTDKIFKDTLDAHNKIDASSSVLPLSLQIVSLLAATIFIFSELHIVFKNI